MANGNQGGQGQNNQAQAPRTPARTLHVFAGQPVKQASGNYSTNITAKTCAQGVDDLTAAIRIISNGTDIHSATGRLNYQLVQTPGSDEVSTQLIIESGALSEIITITTPARAAAPSTRPEDPESLLMSATSTETGHTVFTTITNGKGDGLTGRDILFRVGNQSFYRQTDANGNCEVECTAFVTTDAVRVYARTTGIKGEASVMLRPESVPPAKPDHWWQWNNGRAIALLIATVAIWALCLFVGYGKPIITDGKVSTDSKVEMTANQKLFAEIQTAAKTTPVAVPVQAETYHPVGEFFIGKLWFLAFVLLFFSPLYFIWAWREEAEYALREAIHSIMDRSHDSANDPFFEKIGSWLGTVGKASNKATTVVASTGGAEPAHKEGTGASIWTFVKVDLIMELLTELLPRLFKRVLAR